MDAGLYSGHLQSALRLAREPMPARGLSVSVQNDKKTQQKELTNAIPDHRLIGMWIPDHRLIGMCVSVRMVRPSPRSPERQSPVPAAGRFPGLRIITKVRLPGCQSSDNSVLHFPLTVTRSYRICTCFPFDFGRKKVPSSAPAVIFSFYKYSI